MELGLSSARHSDRRTATITPYRHPGGKVPVLEGSRQASARQPPHQPDQTVARQSRAGGPRAPPRTSCPPAPPRPPPPLAPPPPPPTPPAPLPSRGPGGRVGCRGGCVLAWPGAGREQAGGGAHRGAGGSP